MVREGFSEEVTFKSRRTEGGRAVKAEGMAWEKPTWEVGWLWVGQIEKRQNIIAGNEVEEAERP